ncbi:hypothetical protein ACFQ36_02785 [Arthrobacter sp. GCM10027362]|uniref:hypothetical protein n=1 Tax=Arthrobacter sp. GCM10027362 TaxID=3273379 RepID=UPI0036282D09
MPKNSPVLKARARLGVAARTGSQQDIAEARRDLAAANLEAYIQRTVAEAPPLTQEQLDRIATLLRPAAGGEAA